jgi:NAD(P)-dependent dehydrogenase (short-subunit alcohol dehydrogenase family)
MLLPSLKKGTSWARSVDKAHNRGDGMMKGKVIIITGAASGIGRATALLFAREGVKVVVADIDSDGGEETVKIIKDTDGDAIFIKTDVTVEDEVKAMVEKTVEAYGRLDYAFNNVGTEGVPAPLHLSKTEDWNHTMATNLSSVYYCLKYETAYMIEHGGGAIVNTASIAGLGGTPGNLAYSASKHGVVSLTKSAALEYLSQGIRINSVLPGAVNTPMLKRCEANALVGDIIKNMAPSGSIGEPEDIAEAVLWLCSDKACYVTGHAMVIDGGVRAR